MFYKQAAKYIFTSPTIGVVEDIQQENHENHLSCERKKVCAPRKEDVEY